MGRGWSMWLQNIRRGGFVMRDNFCISGDFGAGDGFELVAEVCGLSDACAFGRSLVGTYRVVDVTNQDDIEVIYQARPVRRPVWDRVADLWVDVQRSRDVETVTIAVCFIAVLMVFLKC